MLESETGLLPLLAHGDTHGEAVRRLAARAELAEPQSLRLRYVIEADPGRVRLPAAAPGAGRADRLWAHTCFEAFVGLGGSPQYLELNFSPSGEWAAYRFESYRQGMAPAALAAPPRLAMRRGEGLELDAELDLGGTLPGWGRSGLGARAVDPRLLIALSAVVEDQEGGLSYWSLRHPPGRPDFHHPDGFILSLPFPWNPAS